MNEAQPLKVGPVPEARLKSNGNGGDKKSVGSGESKPVQDATSDVSEDAEFQEVSVTKSSIKPKKKKKKKKKQGVKFNYQNAAVLEQQVQMNLVQNSLAHQYFKFRQYWYFTLPQAFLTAIASVLAFAASSEMLKEYAQYINLFVGSISAAVVLFQTISGIRQYGVKADRHQNVAVQLRDLRDDLIITKFKLNEVQNDTENRRTVCFENVGVVQESSSGSGGGHGGGDVDSDAESDPNANDTFQDVQKRYQTCLSGCTSVVPIRITEAFHGVRTNLEVAETRNNIKYLHNLYGNFDYNNQLKSKAYDILAGEIINNPLFPMRIPNSKVMVDRTMIILKNRLKEQANFYDDVFVDIENPGSSFFGRFSAQRRRHTGATV